MATVAGCCKVCGLGMAAQGIHSGYSLIPASLVRSHIQALVQAALL